MTNTSIQNEEIILMSVKDGKYHVKIKNVDIPITLNEYLYKKWTNQNSNMDLD